LAAIEQLEDFPQSGRVVPEFGRPEFRELIRGSYRIVLARMSSRALANRRIDADAVPDSMIICARCRCRSNGAQRGTADVPRTVKIAEIGRDYVLGIITDDDGVERIAAFALRRP
jgi:hypothetical protein